MLFISIDKTNGVPLFRQICEGIRHLILSGALPAHTCLPSAMQLSRELCVSRNLIVDVYDQLKAESYLYAKKGSGTYVAENAYLDTFSSHLDIASRLTDQQGKKSNCISFFTGVPIEEFPRSRWAHSHKKAVLSTPRTDWGYGNSRGSLFLRQVLSSYLLRSKGISCSADQIVIIDGTNQGLEILRELFSNRQLSIALENPLLHHVSRVFKDKNIPLTPLPLDSDGIILDSFDPSKSSAIHVCPSHHFPLGITMPIQRRIELIHSVASSSCMIIENDYDSEFCFTKAPISSLHLLKPEKVIHIASFSGTMYPALRLAYMIAPQNLIPSIINIKESLSLHTSILKQNALAHFIEDGFFERHLLRVKSVYKRKHALVRATLENHLLLPFSFPGTPCGQYQAIQFKYIHFNKDFFSFLSEEDVLCDTGDMHTLFPGSHDNLLVLCFGGLSDDDIVEGVKRLCRAIKRYCSYV